MAVRKRKPIEANDGSYGGAVLAVFDQLPEVHRTIVFEDHGQDFLEWDIDSRGEVIACRPFQSGIWVGVIVTNPDVEVGERVRYRHQLVTNDERMSVRYPVEDIR